MANDSYHEPVGELTDDTRDMHRAVSSLMEEFEAVDWYNQRVDACKDPELKAILEHNRDEEKEHAAWCLSGFGGRTRPWTSTFGNSCSKRGGQSVTTTDSNSHILSADWPIPGAVGLRYRDSLHVMTRNGSDSERAGYG